MPGSPTPTVTGSVGNTFTFGMSFGSGGDNFFFGYSTYHGCSPVYVERYLEAQRPDVLLSDIGLPDGSGVDLMRAIQSV